jgi:branched-chain amino acid transport system ATP-binding protein
MVEHDMSVVFGLADRISVLVLRRDPRHDTPERILANARVQAPISGTLPDA